MSPLRFEWDPTKAASNRKKHGVSFEEARTVFADEDGLFLPDPDHSGDEDRFILLGRSRVLRTLVVCHCWRERDSEEVVRIVSARKATARERSQYERRRKT